MGIQVASNFDLVAALPLDSRTVVADLTARDAIVSGVRYEGLSVYVESEQTFYTLIGGITNGDWVEGQGGGGGTGTGIGDVDTLTLENYEGADIGDYTAVNATLSTVDPINGTTSALLDMDAGAAELTKGSIPVPEKFRGKRIEIDLLVKTNATPSNLTMSVDDETNVASLLTAARIIPGYYQISGDILSGFDTITNLPSRVFNFLSLGDEVQGTGIPAGTTIIALSPSLGIVQMSQDATSNTTTTVTVRGKLLRRKLSFNMPRTCESISYTIDGASETGAYARIDDVLFRIQKATPVERNLLNLDLQGEFRGEDESNFRGGVGTWAAFADAASATPVDLTGGTPAGVSIARATGNGEILSGQASGLITKDAANRQGEGVSCTFYVEPGLQGKLLTGQINFRVLSGSLVSGDLGVFLYNVSLGRLITPFNNTIIGSRGLLNFTFMADAAFTTTDETHEYRLGIYFASTSATALSLLIDQLSIAAREPAVGVTRTATQQYAPAITGTSVNPSKGTIAVDRTNYYLLGDYLYMDFNYRHTAGGSSGTGTYLIAMPPGFVVDNTRAVVATDLSGSCLGPANVGNTLSVDANSTYNGYVTAYNTTQLAIVLNSSHVSGNSQNRFWGSNIQALSNTVITAKFTAIIPVANVSGNLPISQATTFLISSILANGTRVTTTPTRLGEYRSYQKGSSSTSGTDTAPNTAPSAANGIAIGAFNYATAGSGTFNISCYEIFIGRNVNFDAIGYVNAGRTGELDIRTYTIFGATESGCSIGYDPTTGVLKISCMPATTSNTLNYVGVVIGSGGAVTGQATGYFDIIVSQPAIPVQISPLGATLYLEAGNGHGSTNTRIRRFTTIRENSDVYTYTDSATLGMSVQVNEDGVYEIFYSDRNSASLAAIGVSVDSSNLTTDINTLTYAQGLRGQTQCPSNTVNAFTKSLRLRRGQIIRAHTDGTPNLADQRCVFSIVKVAN